MEGMDHDHMMTPEQMTELREKVPLYAVSDRRTDHGEHGAHAAGFLGPHQQPKDMQGDIGVLALGPWLQAGRQRAVRKLRRAHIEGIPHGGGAGMAMMSSSHIQKAIDELTSKHGVKTIVVVPMEPGDDTSLVRQWKYIFGLRDDAPYLSGAAYQDGRQDHLHEVAGGGSAHRDHHAGLCLEVGRQSGQGSPDPRFPRPGEAGEQPGRTGAAGKAR